ncbi:hypothetical protein [Xanthomonas sacchari]|nr:hypothetical protein [Xanthomonas sacchari]
MSLKHTFRTRLRHPLIQQRHARSPAKGGRQPTGVEITQVPASVVVDLQRMDEAVETLDAIYQDVLTAIERQARDAITLNHDLTVLFTNGHGPAGPQVLDWSAERAMAPFDAFRQLAERLMDELRPILDPAGRLLAVPYHDLIEWPDLPSHGTPNERLLATIAYARQRRLTVFLAEVKARFQPEKIPENAAQLAAADIMAGFCVEQPDVVLLPVSLHSGAACLTLRLAKSSLSMYISKANLNVILRVNAAIATIARLNGKHKQATILNEGSNAMLLRLSGRQFQFTDHDRHQFADELIVIMRPDHLQYHMPQTLYDLIAGAIRTHAPSVIILQR